MFSIRVSNCLRVVSPVGWPLCILDGERTESQHIGKWANHVPLLSDPEHCEGRRWMSQRMKEVPNSRSTIEEAETKE